MLWRGDSQRREQLRTNLWLVPSIEVLAAGLLAVATVWIDWAAFRGQLSLPSWVVSGTPDAARVILATLAAAIITVVGVVFSIMIVTLTLASTQFGPRMLRNFVRDRGTQFTLGTFVATFVYAITVLVVIGAGGQNDFVPHLSVTVAIGLVLLDLCILIYFIHHVATEIQLPTVIASIAQDLTRAIEAESADKGEVLSTKSEDELAVATPGPGAIVPAPASGYLQFIRHGLLVSIATELDAVIRLHHRPGHFLVRGYPFATVWPPERAPAVSKRLRRTNITGPNRTLTQDVAFAVDQLVEIAIRALSPAVNDTFTALTCVDWLGEGLCRVAAAWEPQEIYRDAHGGIRLITVPVSYERLVDRAFHKIRQASRGMPAVMIRQLDALTVIMSETTDDSERAVLVRQAEMIRASAEETVPDEPDRADVMRRYDAFVDAHIRKTAD
jgi:uncharacterized membrane protein